MKELILIVEDEARNLKLVRDLLEVHGYRTIHATDGKQAVETANEHMPDLILMDIQLPVMDGFQATAILKSQERTRNIPVVALTAYAMKGDEEKAHQAGCDGYIAKPVELRQLLKTVEECLAASRKQT